MDVATAATALGIGLAGAGHCLGMCGGIASALSLSGATGTGGTLAYHAGRLCSYALLGALLAGLAGAVELAAWTLALRYLAGVMLVAMGLYVTGWWRGLQILERAGAVLWRPVQRQVGGLLPLRSSLSAFPLGLVWGLMPCGLIYSALVWSASAADGGEGALRMLLFGLGTLPAMLTASFAAAGTRALLRRQELQVFIGIALIAAGAWTIAVTARHADHLQHAQRIPGTADAAATDSGPDSSGGHAAQH